jgi:hypothetical protein
MEKSETVEWVVQDKQTLILRRVSGKMGKERRQGHGK